MARAAPGEATQIIWWIVLGLSLVVLLARFWVTKTTRGRMQPLLAIPDIFIAITWCQAVVMASLMTVLEEDYRGALNCIYGFGNSFNIIYAALCVPPSQESWSLKIGYWAYLSEIVEVGCCKATLYSIYFVSYSRLPRNLQIALISGATFTGITWLLAISAHFFWCGWDIKVNWFVDPEKIYDQVCVALSANPLFIGYTIQTVLTDIILMGLGWRILHFIHIEGRRELFVLGFIFLIGIFSITAALVRFGLLYNHFGNFIEGNTAERFATWISLQALGAFLAALLPTLRSILRLIPKKIPLFSREKWSSWGSSATPRGFGSSGYTNQTDQKEGESVLIGTHDRGVYELQEV